MSSQSLTWKFRTFGVVSWWRLAFLAAGGVIKYSGIVKIACGQWLCFVYIAASESVINVDKVR